MDWDLRDRRVLVTGSGRGLGREIAIKFGEAGCHVVCAYQRDESAAARTASDISRTGASAELLRVDVSDGRSIRAAFEELAKRGVSIDILINNAAIRPKTRIADITIEEWDQVHATNLRGPFLMAQCVIPGMVRQGWGRIINISGLDAYQAHPQRTHVIASKLGLVGLGRALANETGRWGITVNTVVPGVMDLPRYHPEWMSESEQREDQALRVQLVPLGRLGPPEEVAWACLYLASPHSGWVTGQELFVTGGAHPVVRHTLTEYEHSY